MNIVDMKNYVILNDLRKRFVVFLSCFFNNVRFEVNLIIDLMNYFNLVKDIYIFFFFIEFDGKKNEEIKIIVDFNRKFVLKDREKNELL